MVPGFSPTNLGYFQKKFNWNQNKIEINFYLTYALFQSLFDLEIAIEIRQVLNKKKISIQTLYNIANQNNSVINS